MSLEMTAANAHRLNNMTQAQREEEWAREDRGIKRSSIRLSVAAMANVDETGIDPLDDLLALQSGQHTSASLLAHCLDGADADREQGWRDYVSALVEAAR